MISFRTRLVALYAIAVWVLVTALAGIVAVVAVEEAKEGVRASLDAVQRDAAANAAAIVAGRTLDRAAPDLERAFTRPDVRAIVEGRRTRPPFGLDGRGPGGPGGARRGGPPMVPFGARIEVRRVGLAGGTLLLLPEGRRIADAVRTATFVTGLVSALGAVLGIVVGGQIARQAMRPLHEVTAELERFGRGDFTPSALGSRRRDEFGRLAAAYDAASAQVAAALAARAASEREMRAFVADAAHALRTPIAVVGGYVDVLRRGVAPAEAERAYDVIAAEGRRMRDLVARLLTLARLDGPRPEHPGLVDLTDVARAATATAAATAQDRARIVLVRLDDAHVVGDEGELHAALVNVVENALRYAPDGDVEIAVRAEDDGTASIAVRDRGPGMHPADAARAFDRFYRGVDVERSVEGSGLGLAIAKRAAERAGGTVSLETRPGAGTTVRFTLPRAPTA